MEGLLGDDGQVVGSDPGVTEMGSPGIGHPVATFHESWLQLSQSLSLPSHVGAHYPVLV